MGVIFRVCVGKIAIFEAMSMEDKREDTRQNWHENMLGITIEDKNRYSIALVLFIFEFCVMILFYMGVKW